MTRANSPLEAIARRGRGGSPGFGANISSTVSPPSTPGAANFSSTTSSRHDPNPKPRSCFVTSAANCGAAFALSFPNFLHNSPCLSLACSTALASSFPRPSPWLNSACRAFRAINFAKADSALPPYFFWIPRTRFRRASNCAIRSASIPTCSARRSASRPNSLNPCTANSFFSRNSPAAPSSRSHSINAFCTFPKICSAFSSPPSNCPLTSAANSIILRPWPAAA